MRQTVSKNFRDKIIKIFPSCKHNKSHMRFLQYAMFGNNWEDKDKHILKVPQFNLAYCENKISLLKSNNYCGRTFLTQLENVFGIVWDDDWSYSQGECRVAKFKLPETIESSLNQETYKNYTNSKRLYLIDGKKFNISNRRKALKESTKELEIEIDYYRNHKNVRQYALIIYNYMAQVDIKHFQQVIDKNIDEVKEHAKSNIDLKTTQRKSVLELLDCIEESLKPMYKAVENTARLYPANASVLGLPREYRKMLTRGWTEFDIKSSQLSIVSVLWGLPQTHKYLKDGNSVWDLFFDTFGDGGLNYDEVKGFFKESLYSVIFGKEETKLCQMYDEVFGDNGGALFSNLWLIRELLDARESKIQSIANVPGNKYFSHTLKTDFFVGMSKEDTRQFNKTGVMPYAQRHRITSVMAQEVQTIEMLYLNPIFQYAERNQDNFVITLWQHDGFSVKFPDKSKRDDYTKAIINRFQEGVESTKLNPPTYLEYNHLD